jgi:hypothetical protein
MLLSYSVLLHAVQDLLPLAALPVKAAIQEMHEILSYAK